MTDVLGVCLRWSDGECVVQPESGPAVTIPLGQIVSGKPVPPRPSVRQRVSARDVERRTTTLWPGITAEPLGEWLLRASGPVDGRLRRRGNSALAMGDPGMPLPEALERVRGFYAGSGLGPLAVVEVGSTAASGLAELGWTPVDLAPVHTLLGSVARAARASGPPPGEARPDVDGPRAEVRLGGARGRATVDGDWLGLHGLHVEPAQRRSGLGTAVVASLLQWGAEQGAATAWLHVQSDHHPAVAFWERLGFRVHHANRYLAPHRR